MPLEAGAEAPRLSAPNQDGETVELSYDGPTVVYFYPKDDTPGCTTEARQFDKELDSYRAAGVRVYGVSTDDVASHRDFADTYDIEFDLLADPDRDLADAFDVGSVFGGATARTTFVIVDGTVHAVYTDVDPDGHPRAVLADLVDAGVVDLDA